MAGDGTLVAAIGGDAVVTALVNRLYLRVLADAKIAAFFANPDVDSIKLHQRDFLDLALHGIDAYTGRSMQEAHAGHGITDADFDRLMQHFDEALSDVQVAGDVASRLAERLRALRGEVVNAPQPLPAAGEAD